MYPQTRKYYAIIVHHGDGAFTDGTVASLKSCTPPPDKIVVVDHGEHSYIAPETAGKLTAVVRPRQNTGYAGGINTGLGCLVAWGAGEHDMVALMNNDVIVDPLVFDKIGRWQAANRADAVLGAGRSRVNLWTGRTSVGKAASRRYHLAYLDGAFLAASLSVFLRMRGLPDHYFMYWEDVLFSRRLVRRGVQLRAEPAIALRHRSSRLREGSDKTYYLVRNGALFLEQETALPWRVYWRLANRLRLLYHAVRRHRPPAVRQALLDAARGVSGPRKKRP